MSEQIDLSLSPTGGNAARSYKISSGLIADHTMRARLLRANAVACFAQTMWHWVTRRGRLAQIGRCGESLLDYPIARA